MDMSTPLVMQCAPSNLLNLGNVALRNGFRVSVEFDAEGDVWALTLLGSAGRERFVWGRGKWSRENGRGYREVVAHYRETRAEATEAEAATEAAECAECSDGSCVDCAAERADRKGAEECQVKAAKAHDRVAKGVKRIQTAAERGKAAETRAEAARSRAEAAAEAEAEWLNARVAHADALVWSLPFRSTERSVAFGAWLSARYDAADGGIGAEGHAEAETYANRAGACASEGWAEDERAGYRDALERAEHAHKEASVEYGTFEQEDDRGRVGLPSLFSAESACDLISAHSRDVAALVRHAEAAAKAAEESASQAEAWADAAEDWGPVAYADDDDALFALSAPDARVVALSRAHYGVTDDVAEEWHAEAAAESGAPFTSEELTERAERRAADAADAADAAEVRRERAERRATADGVRAAWDARMGVQVPAVPGVLVRVVREGGAPVDVQWSGNGRQCWSHCATGVCPGSWGEVEWCTCEPRPVVIVDGPGEPYAWEDCAECAAGTLGVPVDVMLSAVRRSVDGVADVMDAGSVGDALYGVAAEREAEAVRVRAEADRDRTAELSGTTEQWRAQVAECVDEWRAEAEALMADAVALARIAEGYREARAAQAAPVDGAQVADDVQGAVCSLPDMFVKVRAAARRQGWEFTAEASGDELSASLSADTAAGRWSFSLCWRRRGYRAGYGYGFDGAHSFATWADGRTGPRGGYIRPTLRAVLDVVGGHPAVAPVVGDVQAAPVAPERRGHRLVRRRAERIAEATAEAESAETAAGVLLELATEALRVVDTAPAGDDEAQRAAESAEARWYRADRRASDARRIAERLTQEDADARADIERARGAIDRMANGTDGRRRWVSADGRCVIALNIPEEYPSPEAKERTEAYAAALGAVVDAKDAGRRITSAHYPAQGPGYPGPGAYVQRAVGRASQPLFRLWKAPKIPNEGKPLTDEQHAAWANNAGDVIAETEAAPGVWLPMAAVRVAELAAENGWTVAMARRGRMVIVRAAGMARRSGQGGAAERVNGEAIAVWDEDVFVQRRSGAVVGGGYLAGASLRQILTTVGKRASEAGTLGQVAVTSDSAPAPVGVSDPGGVDAWEGEGGALPASERGERPPPADSDAPYGWVPVLPGVERPALDRGRCLAPSLVRYLDMAAAGRLWQMPDGTVWLADRDHADGWRPLIGEADAGKVARLRADRDLVAVVVRGGWALRPAISDGPYPDGPGRCPVCECREVRGGRCDGCGWTPDTPPADTSTDGDDDGAVPGVKVTDPATADASREGQEAPVRTETVNAVQPSTSALAAPLPPPPVKQKAGRGELRATVAAVLAIDPTKEFSPYQVAKQLGRSAGAVGNALETLAKRGEARKTSSKPRRYSAAADSSGRPSDGPHNGPTGAPETAPETDPAPVAVEAVVITSGPGGTGESLEHG